jgi:hypothetical protein
MEPLHWVTEAELKEAEDRAAKSYDDRFQQALLSEDDVGTVLRCHLVVERTLVAFLKERFGNPDILDKELAQLSYANIVALAVGLGIRPWMKQPLKKLGKIRNRLAHDLGFTLSRSIVSELRDTFPSDRLQAIENLHSSNKDLLGEDGKLAVKDLEPGLQFAFYMTGLYRELLWFLEAVRIAKKRGR